MRLKRVFAFAFAALMFVFAGYMVWHAIERSALEAEIAENQVILDTANGRVAKQQYERNKAIAGIPGASAVRELVQPWVKASAVWRERRDFLKGDSPTNKAAAQKYLDAATAAQEQLREARLRLEAALSAQPQP